MSQSMEVAKEIAETLWLTELFERIDRMNHAIAMHGQILVDIAADDEADDPDARAGAYWIMRTCHEVSELRERIGDRTEIERAALEVVATLRELRAIMVGRDRTTRVAINAGYAMGWRAGTAAEARHHEREFADGGGI